MLEKIKIYYTIRTDEDDNICICRKDNPKWRYVPCNEQTIYFTFDAQPSTTEEAEKLAVEGKAIKTTGIDFYREYFGWDDDKLYMKAFGYDSRTKKYLDAVKRNIGLIEEKHGWDEEKLIEPYTISIWANTSDIEVGKTADGYWCAQYSMRTAIDDYDITRFYFVKKPRENDILTAQKISDLQTKFFLRRLITFTCWECGRKVHWLDVEGNFDKKVDCLEDSYCGC